MLSNTAEKAGGNEMAPAEDRAELSHDRADGISTEPKTPEPASRIHVSPADHHHVAQNETDARANRALLSHMDKTLQDIQQVLMALAEASGASSSRKTRTWTMMPEPTEDAYDMRQTVDYIVNTLPPSDIVQRAANHIQARWNKTSQAEWRQVSNDSKRLEADLSGEGQRNLFYWDLLRGGSWENSTKMAEYGYDDDGYLCLLGEYPRAGDSGSESAAVEHVFLAPAGTTPPWKGQIFGKEWFITCWENLQPQPLALAFSRLSTTPLETWTRRNSDSYNYSRPDIMAFSFVEQYAGPWDPEPTRQWWHRTPTKNSSMWVSVDLEEHGQRYCIATYHMRVFGTGVAKHWISKTSLASKPGSHIALQRSRGTLTAPINGKIMDVVERRFAVAVKSTTQMALPIFSIVNLGDAGVEDPARSGSPRLDGEWEDVGIWAWRGGIGIAAFAFRIRMLCGHWVGEWTRVLDELDGLLKVDLDSILSHERRRRLMIDDARLGLALSEFYFAAIQLLRIAADWIQAAQDDLNDLVSNLGREMDLHGLLEETAAAEAFRNTWDSVVTHQQSLAKPLLARIARKQAELNTLKDGLFNATSVNEASRSTRLNHYILAFTVVTIFYLPLSFVAALFALGMFSWDDPGQKVSFIATAVAVALGTYCFSGLLIWVVGQPEPRNILPRARARLRDWWEDRLSRFEMDF